MNSLEKYFAYYKQNYERAGLEVPKWVLKQETPTDILKIEESDDNLVNVRINGPIDDVFGLSVSELIDQLDNHKGKDLNITLTSPGGFLFDGLSLYGALSDRAKENKVSIRGQGLVGSAAATAYLAADIENRTMSEGTMYFLHGTQVMTLMAGGKNEIKENSERLYETMDATDRNIINILNDRTDIPSDCINDWVDSEKFLNKEEAIEFGIAIEDSSSEQINDADNQVTQHYAVDEGLKQYLDFMRLKNKEL